MKNWQFLVLAVLAFSGFSFGQATLGGSAPIGAYGSSIDAQNLASTSFSGYSFKGKVKGWAYGDRRTNKPFSFKVENLNKGASSRYEVVKLCDATRLDPSDVILASKIQDIKDAQKSGQIVEVSYNGVFDRCLVEFSPIGS